MKRLVPVILIGLTLACVLSCSGTIKKVRSSLVTVKISSRTAMLDIRPATPFEKMRRFLARALSPASADAAIPTIVQDLRLTVSAPDMDTITATVNVAGLSNADFIVEVPNGLQRHFVVEGLDTSALAQYTGDAFADLIGDPILLTINMAPITDVTPPAFAGLLSANVLSSTSVLLSWSPATDNHSAPANIVYLIYQATAPSGEVYTTPTYTTTPGATSYTVSGLAPGTTYYFVARAMDETGNIDANTIERTNATPDTIPPTFAGLVSATTLTATSVQLSWSAATDNVTPQASIKYLVYRANAAGTEVFTTPTYSTSPGAMGYAVNGLAQGIPYYFVVRAQDGAGNIDTNAVEKSVTLADTIPPVFGGLTTISNVTGTSAQISWSPATDSVSSSANIVYLIYQANASGAEIFTTPSYTTLAGAANYAVTGLAPATQYFFVVRAKDEAGNIDANTFEQSSTQLDSIPPAFSGISSVSNVSLNSMLLSWPTASDNVTPSASIVYLISEGTSTSGALSSPTFTTLVSGNTYTATALTPGNTYYYFIRARDLAGNYDTNAKVLSNTYPGKYVATSGTDTNPCTQSAPCLTIPHAQSLTAINEGIFVSAGTYTLFSTMTLTTGNALACTGPNHTTVINSTLTGGAMIAGNQGAIIDGCNLVIAFSGASPMIADNGTVMTVNNCLLKGFTNASSTGIALSTNSTVQNSTLTNFTFNAGSGYAISITGGSALISGNTFTANDNGINLTVGAGTPTPTIEGNTFFGHITGIVVSAGTPTISNNIIRSNTTAGISIPSGSPIITGNTIDLNGTGIDASGGPFSLTITGNTISNNTSFGINLSATGGATATINNNSIYCNNTADFSTNITSPIDATLNSWDHDSTTTPAGPTIPSVACAGGIDICVPANVTYIPFNTAVPSPPACR